MKIITDTITLEELRKMAEPTYGNLVKAVVDIEKEIMVVDAELHADEEMFLIDKGSQQTNLWGINIHPDASKNDWIEFDSMINLRPSSGNKTRSVDDKNIQKKILDIVNKLVSK